MLILSARPCGQDSTSVGTRSLYFSNGTCGIYVNFLGYSISHDSNRRLLHLLSGFGVSKLMFGSTCRCSKLRTHLIRLDRPAAASACPRFGLTWTRGQTAGQTDRDCACIGREAFQGLTDVMMTPSSPKRRPTASVSMGSPTGVPVP